MNNTQVADIIKNGETQMLEFKRQWKDDYLKTLCAFANTDGGIILLGVDDNSQIIGLQNIQNLIETLPNKINNNLGIIPHIEVLDFDDKKVILIEVKKSYATISYHGVFYIRSGSVTIQLNGSELTRFLLKKYGITWDSLEVDNFSTTDIDYASCDCKG